MKDLFIVLTIIIVLSLLIFSCNKQNIEYSKSAFPTSITMGSDATYFKLDSVCLCGYSAYLNTCGTSPSTEAPNMGTQVYQISGPTQARISWKVVSGYNKPQAANLTTGIYKFAGYAWVLGYRSCDGQTMTDNVYDTVQITITKKRR